MAAGALLAGLALGCTTPSGNVSRRSDSRPLRINERQGTVGGVGIGDGFDRLATMFGQPRDTTDDEARRGLPLRTDYDRIGGPGYEDAPRRCTRRPAPGPPSPRKQGLTSISYHGVAFDLCDGRVFYFIATAERSRTVHGVAIGQRLRTAKRMYPQLHCAWAPGDRTDPPRPLYRYCSGRVFQHRYVWFGNDPIRSIAVSSANLGGSRCTSRRCP